jgi:hypothetical protein
MKKLDPIDYFMAFAIIFFMFVGTMSVFSQSFKGEDFKLTTENNISTFTFEDKNSNGSYIDGILVKSYLRISFTRKELDKLFSELKKASKKRSITIKTEKYVIDKYEWDAAEDIFISVGNKIGQISDKESKKLIKL